LTERIHDQSNFKRTLIVQNKRHFNKNCPEEENFHFDDEPEQEAISSVVESVTEH